METKSPLKSKTLWFNAISVLALVIADLTANQEIRDLLGGKVYLLMIVGSMVNMWLRFHTVEPVEKPTFKKKKPTHKDRLDMLDPEKQADDNYIKDF